MQEIEKLLIDGMGQINPFIAIGCVFLIYMVCASILSFFLKKEYEKRRKYFENKMPYPKIDSDHPFFTKADAKLDAFNQQLKHLGIEGVRGAVARIRKYISEQMPTKPYVQAYLLRDQLTKQEIHEWQSQAKKQMKKEKVRPALTLFLWTLQVIAFVLPLLYMYQWPQFELHPIIPILLVIISFISMVTRKSIILFLLFHLLLIWIYWQLPSPIFVYLMYLRLYRILKKKVKSIGKEAGGR